MLRLFLPMQLINYTMQRQTAHCLQQGITFPSNLNLTHTANHWCNEEVIEYISGEGRIPLRKLQRSMMNFWKSKNQSLLI